MTAGLAVPAARLAKNVLMPAAVSIHVTVRTGTSRCPGQYAAPQPSLDVGVEVAGTVGAEPRTTIVQMPDDTGQIPFQDLKDLALRP